MRHANFLHPARREPGDRTKPGIDRAAKNGVGHPLAASPTPPKINIAPAPPDKNQPWGLSPATAGAIESKVNKMA